VRTTVLVLRALGLGDALTGVAALRGLRRAWPGGWIVLAAPAETGGWLHGLGLVDDIVPTTGLGPLAGPHSSRKPATLIGHHVAVNLHGRGPQSHRMLQATLPDRLVAFRCPEAAYDDGPAWTLDEHEVDRWCRLVRSAGGPCGREDLRLASRGPRESYVVIHPGAAAGSRRWPADRWAAVTAALAIGGIDVVVTGSGAEWDLCARVADAGGRSLAGVLDLDGLADVVARAGLVLCGDTGVGHLATAFGTPSVLLFGPTPPTWWGPAIDPDLHAVIWHGDPSPTSTGDPHADTVDPALARVEVEEVLEAAYGLLAGAARGRPASEVSGRRTCGSSTSRSACATRDAEPVAPSTSSAICRTESSVDRC
jgi:ADP-heptose:LPS heptosyltransferase